MNHLLYSKSSEDALHEKRPKFMLIFSSFGLLTWDLLWIMNEPIKQVHRMICSWITFLTVLTSLDLEFSALVMWHDDIFGWTVPLKKERKHRCVCLAVEWSGGCVILMYVEGSEVIRVLIWCSVTCQWHTHTRLVLLSSSYTHTTANTNHTQSATHTVIT